MQQNGDLASSLFPSDKEATATATAQEVADGLALEYASCNFPSLIISSTHFLFDRNASLLSNLGICLTSSAITAFDVPKNLLVLMKCIKNQNSMEGILSHRITRLLLAYFVLSADSFLHSLSFQVITDIHLYFQINAALNVVLFLISTKIMQIREIKLR